jgi:hypothetical protein
MTTILRAIDFAEGPLPNPPRISSKSSLTNDRREIGEHVNIVVRQCRSIHKRGPLVATIDQKLRQQRPPGAGEDFFDGNLGFVGKVGGV